MSQFKTALEASSYQHPIQHGQYDQFCEETIKKMVESGCEYATMAAHAISWAEDQDPFGHVMSQAYPHINAKCFTRLLESFEETLKDKFPDFMAGHGISAMTNRYSMVVKKVAKYPDMIITGARIVEVRADRFFVIFSIWSVKERAIIAEFQAWVVFFNHSEGKTAKLPSEGGVYKDLHTQLARRAEISRLAFESWSGKEKLKGKGNGGLKL